MTRTCTPHPPEQSVQTLGLKTATPGKNASSGISRISWFSGLPQLARVALAPVAAVILKKSRRSTSLPSVMTGRAVERSFALLVAPDAEPHGVVDSAFGNAHLCHVSMASLALD